MQEDPVWLNAGDHNVYRYTWNNPVKYTDPSGLSVGIEYGCMAQLAQGAGTAAGATGGGFVGGVLFGIAGALGEQQAPRLAEHMNTTIALIAALVPAVGCGQAMKAKVSKFLSVCKRKGSVAQKASSFAAGTLVLTHTGMKPIEDVQVGELLSSRDSKTGDARWQPVRARMIREAPQVMRLTVKDEAGRLETVVVTPNHPYPRGDGTVDILRAVSLDPGGLWTAAGYLKPGDKLDSASGQPLEVFRVEVDSTATQVYNFEAAEDHSYAVGLLGAWVHNARIPARKWREKYKEEYGTYPPKDAAGKFFQACHIRALADAGKDIWANIKWMSRRDHIDEYIRNGDFVRWARRRRFL
jgi:hypothetical protein